jgi:hypothetical protein
MYLAEKNRAVCTHTEFILFLKKGLEVTFGHFVCWKRVIIGASGIVVHQGRYHSVRRLHEQRNYWYQLCTRQEVLKTWIYQLTFHLRLLIIESNRKHESVSPVALAHWAMISSTWFLLILVLLVFLHAHIPIH